MLGLVASVAELSVLVADYSSSSFLLSSVCDCDEVENFKGAGTVRLRACNRARRKVRLCGVVWVLRVLQVRGFCGFRFGGVGGVGEL